MWVELNVCKQKDVVSVIEGSVAKSKKRRILGSLFSIIFFQ